MSWINSLWNQDGEKEQYEIMISDLPEYFKHDFEILNIATKYSNSDDLESIKGCKIYHIRILCDYDYEKEEEEIEKIDSELNMKLKQKWMKRYCKEFGIPQSWSLEDVRQQRQYQWWEEDREFELQERNDKEREEREKKVKEKLKWLAYQGIEKFKEYTSLYNLLKSEISTKRDLTDIDIIVIDDGKQINIWTHIPIPWKLGEKLIKYGIKSHITNILYQPYWIDNQNYKKLIDDYTNEIYNIFKISSPTERKSKLETLKTEKPNVVAIRNSIKSKATNLSYYSCPSSWSYKYEDDLKKMKKKNTVYEVKF